MASDEVNRRRFIREGAVAVGAAGLAAQGALGAEPKMPPKSKILSYNEQMEYRRCGKTNQWISAICLGGHWKRMPFRGDDFHRNRREIVAMCLDNGINYIDACCRAEVVAYTRAVKELGRRKQMYMALSYCGHEPRNPKFRTRKALLASLDDLMKQAGLEYVDIWRPTCFEPGGMHSYNTSCEIAAAGEKAIQQGKVRFFGISSHDRRWHEMMIRQFPILSVVLFPYTAKTKEKPKDSIFAAVREKDVGVFGIKPFASNSIFKGSSARPHGPPLHPVQRRHDGAHPGPHPPPPRRQLREGHRRASRARPRRPPSHSRRPRVRRPRRPRLRPPAPRLPVAPGLGVGVRKRFRVPGFGFQGHERMPTPSRGFPSLREGFL